MSGGSSIGVGRSGPGPVLGADGGVKGKKSKTFNAFLTNMQEFAKKVPNLSLGGSFPNNSTKKAIHAKNLVVQPPSVRQSAKVTNVTTHSQTKANISTKPAPSKSLTASGPSSRYTPASQATPFTLGGKSSSTSDWSASGFINGGKGSSFSSTAAAISRPVSSALNISNTNGTTTYEIVILSSESEDEGEEEDEDEDEDDEEEEEEEEEEDGDEDEEEDEDDDDDDDEEDGDEDEDVDDIVEGDLSQQPPQRANSLMHRQDVRPAVRMPMKSSPSVAASVLPQLRDHNQKSVREPRSFDGWKSSIKQLPESPLETPPSSQDRQKDVKRTTLKDICLYESIKANSSSSAPKTSTVFKSRLPEPFQIRSATKISFENRQKRPSHKRKIWADPVVPAAKRQTREDIRRDSTVFEVKNTRRRMDDETERAVDRTKRHHERDARYGDCPFPLPAAPRRPASPPPIDENRVVMQFTVFKTRSPLTEAFDGNLTGKIVRSGSFLDKIAANKRAEALLPSPSPAVARMELDYGEEGSSRNGMLFGRVEYKNGTFVYVYVDCEYQQFGKIDPSEYDGTHMNPLYKQLCLAPRYDVFVFFRKPIAKQDSIVYEYVEEPRPDPVVDEIDNEESDVDDDREEVAEHDVIEIGTPGTCDPDNSVHENDDENLADEDNGDSVSEISTHEGQNVVNGTPKSHEGATEDAVAESARDDAMFETENAADCNQDNSVGGQDEDYVEENALVARLVVGGDENKTRPADDFHDTLGSHFQPKFEGSFTTLALANRKALDAFAKWTRPQPPARIDALMYYRDVLQPSINQLRRQFHEDQDTREVTREAEISWEPCPQFRYEYEAINVVVVKSEMQGPLDLTGAFS